MPPALYALRKTHKKTENPSKGPPVRPVCGAKEAPNGKFSWFLSKIIYDLADSVPNKRECRSSGEMRAACNRDTDISVRMKTKVLSMDVKSLYPSLTKNVCKDAMKWLVQRSELTIINVDWDQVVRYVAVNMSPADIDKEGVSDVIPGRAKVSRRKITTNCLKSKTADTDWLEANPPTLEQKTKLIGLVLAIAVETIMSQHTYMVGDQVFLQSEGGPIGMTASSAIAAAVMLWFDELYLAKAEEAGYEIVVYERYIDDVNQGVVVEDGDTIENVAAELKVIADSVLPCIKMEIDLPENYPEKMLPILTCVFS